MKDVIIFEASKEDKEKEGFLSSILTNFTLPLLNLGVWLSQLGKTKFSYGYYGFFD